MDLACKYVFTEQEFSSQDLYCYMQSQRWFMRIPTDGNAFLNAALLLRNPSLHTMPILGKLTALYLCRFHSVRLHYLRYKLYTA